MNTEERPRRAAGIDMTTRLLWWFAGLQCALGPLATEPVGLNFFRFLDEFVLVGWIAAELLLALVRGAIPRVIAMSMVPVATASAAVLVSGVASSVSLAEIAVGWRAMCLPLLALPFVARLRPSEQEVVAFTSGVAVSALLNCGFAADQLMSAPEGLSGIDSITGTFGPGTANLFGYYCALVLLVCAHNTFTRRRWWYAVVVASVLPVWAAASAIASYLVFALCIVVAALRAGWFRTRSQKLIGAIAFIVAVAGVDVVHRQRYGVGAGDFAVGMLRAQLSANIDDVGNPGRIALAADLVAYLAGSMKTLVFGLGPGTVAATGDLAEMTNSRFGLVFAKTGANFLPGSVHAVAAELGAIGVMVFGLCWSVALLLASARHTRRATRRQQGFVGLALPVTILGAVGGLSEHVWAFQPVAYVVMFFVALAIKERDAAHAR